MLYYRVLPQYDQKPMFRYKCGRPEYFSIYVRHELFTPAEVRRLKLNRKYMEEVDANPKKIWFCFGARFADEDVIVIRRNENENNNQHGSVLSLSNTVQLGEFCNRPIEGRSQRPIHHYRNCRARGDCRGF